MFYVQTIISCGLLADTCPLYENISRVERHLGNTNVDMRKFIFLSSVMPLTVASFYCIVDVIKNIILVDTQLFC